MDTELLSKLIPPTISLIVTSLFGLFIGILVEKFKNRLRIITYQIYTQNLKPNLSKNLVGNLKISLNERVIDSLNTAYVEFENKNNIDLENIVIKFGLSNGGVFQGSEGYLNSSKSWVYWTENHNQNFQKVLSEYNALPLNENRLKDISDEFQNRINYVNQNQDYLIPVFNRKETAHFNFLYEDSFDGTSSDLYVSIIHKSVSLERKMDDDRLAKRNLWTAVSIGAVLVILVISVMSYYYPTERSLIIISSIIGFSYSIVGYLVLGIFNRIKAYFK